MRSSTPHPVDIRIGSRVRTRRMMLGMSQTDLAKLAGDVTFQQMQKYEKGTNRVSGSRLQMIATALGVPVSYFFEGTIDADDEVGIVMPDHLDISITKAAQGLSKSGKQAVLAMINGLKAEAVRAA